MIVHAVSPHPTCFWFEHVQHIRVIQSVLYSVQISCKHTRLVHRWIACVIEYVIYTQNSRYNKNYVHNITLQQLELCTKLYQRYTLSIIVYIICHNFVILKNNLITEKVYTLFIYPVWLHNAENTNIHMESVTSQHYIRDVFENVSVFEWLETQEMCDLNVDTRWKKIRFINWNTTNGCVKLK